MPRYLHLDQATAVPISGYGLRVLWMENPATIGSISINGAPSFEVRSLMEVRGPRNALKPSEFTVNPNGEWLLAVAEAPDESLPAATQAGTAADPTRVLLVTQYGAPLETDDAERLEVHVQHEDGDFSTVANPTAVVLEVSPLGSQGVTFQQRESDSNGLAVVLCDDDGGTPFSTDNYPTAARLNTVPVSVVEVIDSGTISATTATQTTTVRDVSAYSTVVLIVTGILFTGGVGPTLLSTIEEIAPDGTTALFAFGHSSPQSSGAASVRVGPGFTRTDLDLRHSTFGARLPSNARCKFTIAGGPATAAATWKLLGIRGAR